ncbi:unnamed protein product, partial [Ceratitis capitata]
SYTGDTKTEKNATSHVQPCLRTIDFGSECSIITGRLRRRIELLVNKVNVEIFGINKTVSAQTRKARAIKIVSPINALIYIQTVVLMLSHLTEDLPKCEIDPMVTRPLKTNIAKRFTHPRRQGLAWACT